MKELEGSGDKISSDYLSIPLVQLLLKRQNHSCEKGKTDHTSSPTAAARLSQFRITDKTGRLFIAAAILNRSRNCRMNTDMTSHSGTPPLTSQNSSQRGQMILPSCRYPPRILRTFTDCPAS